MRQRLGKWVSPHRLGYTVYGAEQTHESHWPNPQKSLSHSQYTAGCRLAGSSAQSTHSRTQGTEASSGHSPVVTTVVRREDVKSLPLLLPQTKQTQTSASPQRGQWEGKCCHVPGNQTAGNIWGLAPVTTPGGKTGGFSLFLFWMRPSEWRCSVQV